MNLFRQALAAMLIVLVAAPAVAKDGGPVMEVRGLRAVEAPWQNESLAIDTRQLRSLEIATINLSPETAKEWQNVNKDKRGIAFPGVNDQGQNVMSGRSVVKATFRLYLYTPNGDLVMSEAVANPKGDVITLLLPPDGSARGLNAFVLSSRGDYALTLSGELIKLKKKERKDGRLADQLPERLKQSVITSTLLVTRGDGSGFIENLEATFSEHAVLDGSLRYSGLSGTFFSLAKADQERYPSVAALYTREDTVGDRLITCGNGTIDPTLFTGLGAIVRGISLGITALKSRC